MSDISKLPKWARDKLHYLELERDAAIRELNNYLNEQAPSSFIVEDFVSTGESQGPTYKVRYIQTHRMKVKYNGVELDIYLRDNIDLQWSGEHKTESVAFIPTSYQSASLCSKKNMR